MTQNPHHTDYSNISEAILAFGQLARFNDLNVGVQESIDALETAKLGMIEDKMTFQYALKSIFCASKEDIEVFEKIYDWFWGYKKGAMKSKTTFKNRSNLQKKSVASVVMMGKGESKEEGEESKNVSGANRIARLRKTDFSKIEEIDSEFLEELAIKLWQQMSLRLKRKMKFSSNKGRLDLRRTIRSSISHGGEPFELKRKKRTPRKQRLIVLLDVSGSMDKYSFFLLRFICALRTHFESIEAFIFSTHLIRITDYLHAKNLALTLAVLSAKADNWSSGTKIGECFKDFNELYAKRILNGQSTTIVLSDGLDTGEPEVLEAELKKIKLRTRRLIWLNPLKGMKGYEPIQKGMRAALPNVDVFRSAHNLDSILELEELLLSV
ncbi:MAG: VWA domain-containing protein [Chitinophagales bacterium]